VDRAAAQDRGDPGARGNRPGRPSRRRRAGYQGRSPSPTASRSKRPAGPYRKHSQRGHPHQPPPPTPPRPPTHRRHRKSPGNQGPMGPSRRSRGDHGERGPGVVDLWGGRFFESVPSHRYSEWVRSAGGFFAPKAEAGFAARVGPVEDKPGYRAPQPIDASDEAARPNPSLSAKPIFFSFSRGGFDSPSGSAVCIVAYETSREGGSVSRARPSRIRS